MKHSTKAASFRFKMGKFLASFLALALCVCANTTSSIIIHQPKAPEGIERFKRCK